MTTSEKPQNDGQATLSNKHFLAFGLAAGIMMISIVGPTVYKVVFPAELNDIKAAVESNPCVLKKLQYQNDRATLPNVPISKRDLEKAISRCESEQSGVLEQQNKVLNSASKTGS